MALGPTTDIGLRARLIGSSARRRSLSQLAPCDARPVRVGTGGAGR